MNITANGTYKLEQDKDKHAVVSIVYVSGNLGAATVTLNYHNEVGTLTPLQDGAVTTSPSQYKVEHGLDVDIYVNVTGADGSTNFYANSKALF